MVDRLELGVCANFAREFAAVLSGPGFEGVSFRVRRSSCLGPPAPSEAEADEGAAQLSVRCSPARDEAAGEHVDLEQCFTLFASHTLVTGLQAAGAFVVTPGWVRHWRARVEAWGFTQAQARAFFAESMKEVVLLDTTVEVEAPARALEFAEFIELPVRVLPVGLDYARERLRAVVAEWRLKREQARSLEARRRAAELSMALELIRGLTSTSSEPEVMERLLDFFSVVFAPAEVAWRPIVAGQPGAVVPTGIAPRVAELLASVPKTGLLAGDELVLRLTAHGATTSVVWAGGIPFPERRAEYLALASSVSELFGLLVASARDRARQRRVELELRQSQKLESIGRLSAGIAHEINTPAQFVGDSVAFAHDASQGLVRVLAAARATCATVEAGGDATDALARLRALEHELDLPFLIENFPAALGHAERGLERIATIVRAMREFSHPPGDDKACFDVNRALQATAVVAHHEYKYVAELEWALGDVPQVWGYLAELNQALLNLLVNAAQAIADVVKGTGAKGRITLRTYREGEQVVVAIGDTGVGIAPEAQEHLFEQFFTTREVGRGTGQGLAVAWRIVVERHGGSLSFETRVGQGTTFFVRLPHTPPEVAEPDGA